MAVFSIRGTAAMHSGDGSGIGPDVRPSIMGDQGAAGR